VKVKGREKRKTDKRRSQKERRTEGKRRRKRSGFAFSKTIFSYAGAKNHALRCKKASASGGLCPPDSLPGFVPEPQWGTSVFQISSLHPAPT